MQTNMQVQTIVFFLKKNFKSRVLLLIVKTTRSKIPDNSFFFYQMNPNVTQPFKIFFTQDAKFEAYMT